jgi:hypothetical protein
LLNFSAEFVPVEIPDGSPAGQVHSLSIANPTGNGMFSRISTVPDVQLADIRASSYIDPRAPGEVTLV